MADIKKGPNEKQNRWMRLLAREVLDALTAAKQGPRLSAEELVEVLAERPKLRSLIDDVESRHSTAKVKTKEEKTVDIEALKKKYNLILDNYRKLEDKSQEIEDIYKQLALSLAALAEFKNQPDLCKELAALKKTLDEQTDPQLLLDQAKSLKNLAYQLGNQTQTMVLPGEEEAPKAGGRLRGLFRKSPEPAPEPIPETPPLGAAPEGLEDSIRDILVALLRYISEFEDEILQEQAGTLAKRLAAEFTIGEYKPFLEEIHQLILRIKETVLQEKRGLVQFTKEIFTHLEDTERDLIRNLDTGVKWIEESGQEFERQVSHDVQGIEDSFSMSGATVEQIRPFVLEKIASIRARFQKKRAEDQARLEQMEREKNGVEKRLEDMHVRYQTFAKQSEAMLKEMEKFRKASMKDALTGTFNRRAYDLQIKKALEGLKDGSLHMVSLVVFDIDHFKNFNNNYGHRAGDLTLKHVAKFAGSTIRKQDILARYGGDEFTIILPEVDLDNAARIADKIRSTVSEVEFKIYRDRDMTVRVNLSMGVAACRSNDDAASAFHRADQALYVAKERGRNQVCTEKDIS